MEGTTVNPALSKYLVIDSGGFIKNVPLVEFGQNLITMHEVIEEIRDKETKQRIRSLPFELQFLEPDPESIAFVTEFSKKTGDYASLSATDIKVIALTYMLEKRHVGMDHLKKEPTTKKSVEFYNPAQKQASSKMPVGFYAPEGEEEEVEDEPAADRADKDSENVNENVNDSGSDEGIEEDESEEDADEDGWITPSNFKQKRMEMLGVSEVPEEEDKEKIVACVTTDFAMQNVLKQIGLHALSSEGVFIKETKTWILRCYACFSTTPKMDKRFCPKCGNQTLKRVSVTLNADGTQQIHISTRRQLTGRGTKFSLPKPQGGKYAVNPILCADQPIPQQRKTALARKKTDAMGEDYVSGQGPFVMNDVNSRSAMLGIGMQGNHYWDRKNPNASGRRTGNRKKKNRN